MYLEQELIITKVEYALVVNNIRKTSKEVKKSLSKLAYDAFSIFPHTPLRWIYLYLLLKNKVEIYTLKNKFCSRILNKNLITFMFFII